jgi:hypothetical protein
VVYSPKDDSIYYGVDNYLYRLVMGGKSWQKIAELGEQITEITLSSQGLYLFCKPRVYFSPFPLTKDSQWERVDVEGNWAGYKLVEVERESNLLILWNSSEILFHHHVLEEELEEEILPEPAKEEPAVEEPVIEETIVEEPVIEEPTPEPTPEREPEPTEPPKPPPAEKLVPPQPTQEKSEGGHAGYIVTIITLSLVIVALITFIIILKRRYYI